MGLTSWKNSPNGKIMESDVIIAKNYLSNDEIKDLEGIVSAFLEFAENRARRHIPMTMEDWDTRIDKFLLADDRDILKDAGKISHEIAKDKALTEFDIAMKRYSDVAEYGNKPDIKVVIDGFFLNINLIIVRLRRLLSILRKDIHMIFIILQGVM